MDFSNVMQEQESIYIDHRKVEKSLLDLALKECEFWFSTVRLGYSGNSTLYVYWIFFAACGLKKKLFYADYKKI